MSWEQILAENKLPTITGFSNVRDLSEDVQIEDVGKLTLEQVCTILDHVDRLDEFSAIVLPKTVLYRVDARTVRKNVRQVELRRLRSKREAIQERATPEGLIKERLAELHTEYKKDPEKLLVDYGGINYRGITSRMNHNYSISDSIRGYLHAQLADDLIHVERYDRLESLLVGTMTGVPASEKAAIRAVLLKIRNRATMTDKLKKIPESARKIILTRQSERIVGVPSTSHQGFHPNIRFRRLPLAFPDDAYPDLNKEYHASWTDVTTQPSCNCQDKTWFITYLKPGETWHCVHEIAAFRAMAQREWKAGKPTTSPDPYIAASPFFKPTQAAIDFYHRLRNQVFVNMGERSEHLPYVYIDLLLMKQAVRGKLKLL